MDEFILDQDIQLDPALAGYSQSPLLRASPQEHADVNRPLDLPHPPTSLSPYATDYVFEDEPGAYETGEHFLLHTGLTAFRSAHASSDSWSSADDYSSRSASTGGSEYDTSEHDDISLSSLSSEPAVYTNLFDRFSHNFIVNDDQGQGVNPAFISSEPEIHLQFPTGGFVDPSAANSELLSTGTIRAENDDTVRARLFDTDNAETTRIRTAGKRRQPIPMTSLSFSSSSSPQNSSGASPASAPVRRRQRSVSLSQERLASNLMPINESTPFHLLPTKRSRGRRPPSASAFGSAQSPTAVDEERGKSGGSRRKLPERAEIMTREEMEEYCGVTKSPCISFLFRILCG
jgi:hypothetical protein